MDSVFVIWGNVKYILRAVIFSPSLGEIVNEVAGKYKEHLQAEIVLYSGI